MAIQLKVDTEDFPGIISMLGLGGSSPSAPTPDAAASPAPAEAAPAEPPPVDPSLGGAGDPGGQPDTSNAPEPKNKLQTLREFLNPGPATPDAPVPPLQVPGQSSAMAPADLAQSEAAGTAHIKPTFREAHPLASTLLRVALNAGEGGLVGSQYANAGQGFEAGKQATDPIHKKMEDAALAEKQAAVGHTQAATEQMKTQVTLPNGLTVPFALAQKLYPAELAEMGKNSRNQANIDSREGMASDRNAIALRAKGLKPNPAGGSPIPLTRDEMSETEQATLDLKQSQQDAAAARAEVDRNKNNPNSPAYKAAMGRLQVAAKNVETAAGRLGLAKDTFNANYLGTGPDGQALPGAALTENGTPVGVRVSNVTKPTNATRSKAEQAGVIKQQGEDILKQIDANPDLYGVVAGRWNELQAGKFGNASQEVRDAYTSLKSFAALQPALHGARGIGMMHEFEDAVGNMGNDPDALKGSINSLLRTAGAFQKAGTMKTAPGGGTHPAATHVYDPSTGVIAPIKK
jgi:hypothetical protein